MHMVEFNILGAGPAGYTGAGTFAALSALA